MARSQSHRKEELVPSQDGVKPDPIPYTATENIMRTLHRLTNAVEELTRAMHDVQDSQVRLEERVTTVEVQMQCVEQQLREAGVAQFYELTPRGTPRAESPSESVLEWYDDAAPGVSYPQRVADLADHLSVSQRLGQGVTAECQDLAWASHT